MAAFKAGDIVVERVGDGTGPLVNTGNAVFLDEYDPTTGALVQTVALPTTASGGNHALFSSGTATSEGLLTLSADAHYLVLTGYSATSGSAVTVTTSVGDPRTVALVSASGGIDTTTALTDFSSGNNARGAATIDGTGFFLDGGAGGVVYATLGATTSTSVSSTFTNLRDINIFNGQLYVSSGSSTLRIGAVGVGTSNTAGQTTANITGISSTATGSPSSPYQFFFTHLGVTGTGPDTLYVADDSGKVEKFSFVSGSWVANGTLADPAVRGLTGVVSGTSVTLYTTTGGAGSTGGGSLDTFTDTSGYNGTINGTLTHLATAAANTAFRGVAFAPTAAVVAPPASLSISSISQAEGDSGTTNFAFTITRAGDASAAVSFDIATVDGTAAAGSDFVAKTLTGLTIAAAANTATFTVVVNGDTTVEADETFGVHLSNVTGATAPTADGVGTIINDDVAQTGFPTGPQSTTYAITAAGTYQLPAGQTLTETGAVTAVTVTDTATALTAIDIQGALNGATGQRGVIETVPNGELTVGAAGSIHTFDGDGFQFKLPTSGGGHANVTNLGSIVSATTIGAVATGGSTAPKGYALNFNAATGGAGVTDHTSGGLVVNGSTTNATALLESDSSDAVRLGANQTLTNYGRILGKGPVNDAASNNSLGGGSTTQKYDSSRGVEINGFSHDTIDNFGRIEGAQHGIDAGDAADTDVTVINEAGGVVIGHNGSGVGSDGAGSAALSPTNVTVTNSGAIYGEYAPTYDRSGASTTDGDGDGVDIDGAATVTNNAGAVIAGAGAGEALTGTGAGGFDSNGRTNHSEGLSLGGGVVQNHGLISGADYGITVNNDGNANRSGVADTQITNESDGTIIGRNGYAIRLENKGADSLDTDTVTNHGVITGGGGIPAATGAATIQGGGPDQNTVGTLNGVAYAAGDANSNRFVSGDGAAIQTGEGNDTVLNDGTITGTNGHAISLEGGDDSLTLYAAGAVNGAIDGGVGADTLNLTTGTTGATANTLTGVVNVETLNVLKGAWTLTDAESYSAGATISAGASLQLGAGGTAGGLTGAIADNGALIVNRSDAVTLDGTVAGVGTLSQVGTGTTTLSAAHAFTGVTLSAGVLDVAAAGGAGAGAITFAPASGATPLLRVEKAATTAGDFAPVIKGFVTGATLDAAGVGTNATATLGANNTLTVTGSGGSEIFHLDPAQSFTGKVFATAADAGGTGVNITLTTAPNAPVTLFSEDFASFTAAGFAPTPTAGQLDSDVWRVIGLSDAPNPAFGFIGPAAGDFGRGVIVGAADPVTAGVYSPSANHALVIQPTGAELDANGVIEAHIVNGSGMAASAPTLDFDWTYRNSGARGDALQLSYSTDDVNFTVASGASFTTPSAADATPAAVFSTQHETVTLSGVNLPAGGDLYLRWTHLNSAVGSGNRDEVGIDNVQVQATSLVPSSGSAFSVSNAAGGASQVEGAAGATTPFGFVVTRTGDLSAAQTVDYAVTGSGIHPADAADFIGATLPSGTLNFAAGAATANLTINVAGDAVTEQNETFTVALSNASTGAVVLGSPASATILNDDNSLISIADIQGASQTSPFVGQTLNTQGVVTAIKTGAGGGFYIQDNSPGGPPGASHGLFIFTNATPTVAVGDAVTVQGVVTEYVGGDNSLPTTELNNPVVTVGTQHNPVTPIVIGAGGVLPPTTAISGATYDPAHNGIDFYESLEGQLVTVKNAMAVDTSYGSSTWVVADNGAEATGINARGGITITADDFNPERIQVYSSDLHASLGEHLGDITGVVTYYNGEYELIPTAPITAPATPPPVADVPDTLLKGDATHLAFATYNVENLDPGDPDARFALLGQDIAHSLGGPDIITLEEIQDADGAGTGTNFSGAATLTKLIAAITAAGGPAYQFVDIAPTADTGGEPGGHIQVAFLYNPARVGYVDGSAQLIHDQTPTTGTRTDHNAFYNSREPLLANFTFNGQTITTVGVHNYSRSGSEELFGSHQPAANSGDDVRLDQSTEISNFLVAYQQTHPGQSTVVAGDFNAFYFEPSLTVLGGALGLTNLVTTQPVNERYSTEFEGLAQQIDNILVSPGLAGGAQLQTIHVNTGQSADTQASDHDPVISLLTIGAANGAAPVFTSAGTAAAFEGADDDTVVYRAAATDADTAVLVYSLSGGADAALFNIDTASGAVTFKSSPSYDRPTDAGANNVYDIVVQASDGVVSHNAIQAVAITVADVATVTTADPTVTMTQTVDSGSATTITGTIANSGTIDFTKTTPLTFSGSISGSGTLEKQGAGTLTLSGVSTYTGQTKVDGGLLVVDGSIASSPVIVGPGATLGGHGTTGPVTLDAGATFSPGNSPGTINTGSLSLTAGAAYKQEFGGFAAGQFDLVNVTGTVALNGATLNTSLYNGFAPTVGSAPLVIIANDGTDAVTGIFTGLAEGATFTLGGVQVKISYVGGTGNDVTLQFAAPAVTPPPITTTPTTPTPSIAAQFTAVGLVDPSSAEANTPTIPGASGGVVANPLYVQAQAQGAISAQFAAGTLSAANAQTALFHLVDGTTSLAEISYAFFTGKSPTAAGLAYLVHDAANPNDLNDAYYARFSTENRYINMSVGLGTGQGAGAAAFTAAYGNLSLSDAATKAYTAVFGTAPVAGKIDAILNALVPNGLGGQETRAQYLTDVSGGTPLAQKAALVGFLLADSVKEGFGTYQQADLHFLQNLSAGNAAFNVDLLATYGPAVTVTGAGVADPTVLH